MMLANPPESKPVSDGPTSWHSAVLRHCAWQKAHRHLMNWAMDDYCLLDSWAEQKHETWCHRHVYKQNSTGNQRHRKTPNHIGTKQTNCLTHIQVKPSVNVMFLCGQNAMCYFAPDTNTVGCASQAMLNAANCKRGNSRSFQTVVVRTKIQENKSHLKRHQIAPDRPPGPCGPGDWSLSLTGNIRP